MRQSFVPVLFFLRHHVTNLRVLHEHSLSGDSVVLETEEAVIIGVHAKFGTDLANLMVMNVNKEFFIIFWVLNFLQ